MTTMSVVLDKKAYPVMMHLSILPKYSDSIFEPIYNPETQTSDVSGMSGSWCQRTNSTGGFLQSSDDDSQEDD